MSREKLEKALEHLINEDKEQAEELLHEYYVGLARQVWSDLVESDEIEEEKIVDEANEEELEEDFGSEDDEADFLDDVETDKQEIEAEEYFGEEGEDGEEGDADMGDEAPAGDAEKAEDAIMNVEDALSELKATFAEIMGDDAGEEGDAEADMDMDMEMPEMPEESVEQPVAEKTEEVSETDEAVEEAKDEAVEEAKDDAKEEAKTEDLDEDLREYTEKKTADNADHADNKASPVGPGEDVGGESVDMTKGGEETGRSAPSSGSMGTDNQDAKLSSAPKPKMTETKRAKK